MREQANLTIKTRMTIKFNTKSSFDPEKSLR